jgi:hypothetical protein
MERHSYGMMLGPTYQGAGALSTLQPQDSSFNSAQRDADQGVSWSFPSVRAPFVHEEVFVETNEG